MKHYTIIILFVIATFFALNASIAQDLKRIAELQQDLKTATTDSSRITALSKLADKYAQTHFDSVLKYANKAIEIAVKNKQGLGMAYAYNSVGDAYWYKSDFITAQEYYFKSYQVSDSINDKKAMALALYSMGWVFCVQQNDLSKLNYLYQSKQLYTLIKDDQGISNANQAIMRTYVEGYKNDLKNKPLYDSAIYYASLLKQNFVTNVKAKELYYFEICRLHYFNNDFNSAIFFGEKGIEVCEKEKLEFDILDFELYIILCKINVEQPNKTLLIKINELYDYYNSANRLELKTESLKGLALYHYKTKDYKTAYEYGLQYYDLKNKLDKEIYSSRLSNLTQNYIDGKTNNHVHKLEQETEMEQQKNKTKNYLLIAIFAGVIALLGFAYSLRKQNKQKHLANKLLEDKNHIIAEKISEIDKSIQYAKGIQMAVLPSPDDLTSQFENSFVYYVPKDVVSGDFYWFAKTNDYFYCVVADCTGHGVPGAFMSMIGMSKLTQAIFQNKLSNPSDILSFLNIEIKHDLKQYSLDNKQKDGMDLSLLKFHNNHSIVEYCAANRPLMLIRNKELIEHKADKAAIGGFTSDDQYYKTTSISLLKGDSLYLFTDGYADQFGGSEGKKFMSKQLKQLLMDINNLSSSNQYQQIEEAFQNWKKEYEQVDDVLVLGITI